MGAETEEKKDDKIAIKNILKIKEIDIEILGQKNN